MNSRFSFYFFFFQEIWPLTLVKVALPPPSPPKKNKNKILIIIHCKSWYHEVEYICSAINEKKRKKLSHISPHFLKPDSKSWRLTYYPHPKKKKSSQKYCVSEVLYPIPHFRLSFSGLYISKFGFIPADISGIISTSTRRTFYRTLKKKNKENGNDILPDM